MIVESNKSCVIYEHVRIAYRRDSVLAESKPRERSRQWSLNVNQVISLRCYKNRPQATKCKTHAPATSGRSSLGVSPGHPFSILCRGIVETTAEKQGHRCTRKRKVPPLTILGKDHIYIQVSSESPIHQLRHNPPPLQRDIHGRISHRIHA